MRPLGPVLGQLMQNRARGLHVVLWSGGPNLGEYRLGVGRVTPSERRRQARDFAAPLLDAISVLVPVGAIETCRLNGLCPVRLGRRMAVGAVDQPIHQVGVDAEFRERRGRPCAKRYDVAVATFTARLGQHPARVTPVASHPRVGADERKRVDELVACDPCRSTEAMAYGAIAGDRSTVGVDVIASMAPKASRRALVPDVVVVGALVDVHRREDRGAIDRLRPLDQLVEQL